MSIKQKRQETYQDAMSYARWFAWMRNIEFEILRSPKRNRDIVLVRRQAMKYLRKIGFSYPIIGKVFNRDHTTVIHNCRIDNE